MLKKYVEKFNITNLKLFYEGNHNKTYKGFINDEIVQIRVTKNNIVNHSNEILLLKNNSEIIYIDSDIMIKKWINGETLTSNSIETLIKIKNKLTKHWYIYIPGITFFEPKKIINNNIVLSHGDLRRKNIIISESEVSLIDFEWISYNHKYFDLAHLHLYCFFNIKDIVDVFNVDENVLKKEILIVNKFNLKWERKNNI